MRLLFELDWFWLRKAWYNLALRAGGRGATAAPPGERAARPGGGGGVAHHQPLLDAVRQPPTTGFWRQDRPRRCHRHLRRPLAAHHRHRVRRLVRAPLPPALAAPVPGRPCHVISYHAFWCVFVELIPHFQENRSQTSTRCPCPTGRAKRSPAPTSRPSWTSRCSGTPPGSTPRSVFKSFLTWFVGFITFWDEFF